MASNDNDINPDEDAVFIISDGSYRPKEKKLMSSAIIIEPNGTYLYYGNTKDMASYLDRKTQMKQETKDTSNYTEYIGVAMGLYFAKENIEYINLTVHMRSIYS